jgi:Spy/CpxP family protein refolding chaperone
MKKVFYLAILLIFVASAAVVEAQPRRMAPGPAGAEGRKGALWSDLNLTEEQSEQIGAMRDSFQKEMMPFRMDIARKKLEMKLLWMEDDPDAAKIKAKQKEIQELRGQMAEKWIDFRLAFRSILTPEQRLLLLEKRFKDGRRRGWDRGLRSHHKERKARGW